LLPAVLTKKGAKRRPFFFLKKTLDKLQEGVYNKTKLVRLSCSFGGKKRGGIKMLISRRLDYALRCLVYLANQPSDFWVSTALIGRRQKVSPIFIAKIFQPLTRVGILESRKGKEGGVRLKNRRVSLAEIIRIIEPRFHLNRCLEKGHHCFLQGNCPISALLGELEGELMRKLGSVSLLALNKKRRG
jgi:Rrf2 family protein